MNLLRKKFLIPVVATLFAFSSMPSMVLAWRERDI